MVSATTLTLSDKRVTLLFFLPLSFIPVEGMAKRSDNQVLKMSPLNSNLTVKNPTVEGGSSHR